MTASELIAILQTLPADMPVYVAYDYLVCVSEVDPSTSFILDANTDDYGRGLYLCAMGEEDLAWCLENTIKGKGRLLTSPSSTSPPSR